MEATAIVSGAAALVLQKYPQLTPDQVKAFLQANADKLQGTATYAQGAGELDLGQMLSQTPQAAAQSFGAASGTGSIEQSRGSDHISQNGVVLSGEQDIFGKPLNSAALATAEASASSWSGGTWNGSSWSGSSWSGSSWSGSSWSSSSWSSSSWS